MRLSTRLLLPLTSMLALIMVILGMWLMRVHERRLFADSVTETRAYATALAIALENSGPDGLDGIIQRVSAEPKIYGLLLYDRGGRVLAAAAPVDPRNGMPASYVQSLIQRNASVTLRRTIGDGRFLSVFRPLHHSGVIDGALEVLQPMSRVEAELSRTRVRFVWSGLLIIAAVVLIMLWMVRAILGRPLHQFLRATRAVGRGELTDRIPPTRSGAEFEDLRMEFNRMADHLYGARERAAVEAEERIALERQLRHSEKMAAVGNLAASLAHEIAAPLNVVAGRAELLRRTEQPEAQRKRNLEIIGEQISRIALIVRNLLDYSRDHVQQHRVIPLLSVIEGVVEFLEGELARVGVRVEMEIAPVEIKGDPDRLHQVFLNLLINSIQALDTIEEPGRVRITAIGAGTEVIVEISDNGPGLTEEVAAQAFEPFFTTKPHRIGTGLGLAVARNIIVEHGGTIEVHPGPGGRFVIRLPASSTNE